MAKEYIPIDSIKDLDVKKVSIHELNRRYIDREGNKWTTRFNLKTRQIEIVQLVSNPQEASQLKARIRREKLAGLSQEKETTTSTSTISSVQTDNSNQNEISDFTPPAEGSPTAAELEIIDEGKFSEECMHDLEKFISSQQAVVHILRKTRPLDNSEINLLEFFRKLDNDGWKKAESIMNYYRELTSYPRPLNHYLNRLPAEKRSQIESLENEEDKMILVRRYELQKNFRLAFEAIASNSEELIQVLRSVPDNELHQMAADNRNAITDSISSLEYVLDSVRKKVNQIHSWINKYPA